MCKSAFFLFIYQNAKNCIFVDQKRQIKGQKRGQATLLWYLMKQKQHKKGTGYFFHKD
jgi:hypothetical protein